MDLAWMSRALQYRNYRLFFTGQIVSLVGNWMTTIATSWLVYRLTGSTLLLGVVGFAGQIPSFLVAPFAGVWVDRLNRHRILKVTQALAMVQSLALAYLTLSGQVTVHHIVVLSALQGFINAFDMPARQSFVAQMIEKKEDLSNAIALNSSMVNAARLVGPALAGAIIALTGEGWCFLLDGLSYLAVLASLMMMRVTQPPKPSQIVAPMQALREGWVYVKNFAPIRTLLLLMAMVSLLSLPYTVLMPAVSTQILHGDSHTLGYLMAGSGVGALTGALFLASRRSVVGLGRIIPMATGILGAGLIAFSFSRVLWLSLLLMPLMGFGFMVQMASSNTLMQVMVEDDKRGRVMSFFTMAFMGTMPFGSLMAGALSSRIGVPHTILVSGICALAAAAWFASRLPSLREIVVPLYREMGILPPEISGVSNATELAAELRR